MPPQVLKHLGARRQEGGREADADKRGDGKIRQRRGNNMEQSDPRVHKTKAMHKYNKAMHKFNKARRHEYNKARTKPA